MEILLLYIWENCVSCVRCILLLFVFVSRNLFMILVYFLYFVKGINFSKFYEEINYFCRFDIWYIFEKFLIF